MFIEALFIIAKMCIQPKCPSTNEWIKKMGYYLVIKRNEMTPLAVTQMHLQITILSVGHLGCMHILAIINSASMNIGVHIYF